MMNLSQENTMNLWTQNSKPAAVQHNILNTLSTAQKAFTITSAHGVLLVYLSLALHSPVQEKFPVWWAKTTGYEMLLSKPTLRDH